VKAIIELFHQGVKTNYTMVYRASHELLAILAPSIFVSPFVGRSEIAGYNGIDVIMQIGEIYDIGTCIIASSNKNVRREGKYHYRCLCNYRYLADFRAYAESHYATIWIRGFRETFENIQPVNVEVAYPSPAPSSQ